MKKILIFLFCTSLIYFNASAQVSFSEVTFYGKPRWIVGNLGISPIKIKYGDGEKVNFRENRSKTVKVATGNVVFKGRIGFNFGSREFPMEIKPNRRYLIYVQPQGVLNWVPHFTVVSEHPVNPEGETDYEGN